MSPKYFPNCDKVIHTRLNYKPVHLFRKVFNKFCFPRTNVNIFSSLVLHFIYKIPCLGDINQKYYILQQLKINTYIFLEFPIKLSLEWDGKWPSSEAHLGSNW